MTEGGKACAQIAVCYMQHNLDEMDALERPYNARSIR